MAATDIECVFGDTLGVKERFGLAEEALHNPLGILEMATPQAASAFVQSVITHPLHLAQAALWGFASDREPDIEQVSAAEIPCHVLWANLDTLLARSDGREFARKLHASFTVASGPTVTHDWMFDAPELFAQHLAHLGLRALSAWVLVTDTFDEQVISELRARGGVVSGLQDLSLLLLHHFGAKSGSERVTPLAFWSVSYNAVAVLASNRGAPRHPDRYHNLVDHPTTTVEIGAETWSVRARVAAPEEQRTMTDRLAAESPTVASAVGRTSRQIPVIIIELLARVDHPPRGDRRR